MGRFRFVYNDIMCEGYAPDEEFSIGKTAILLYGFPATIGQNKVTDELLKNGFTVLQPHYPGMYDSGGIFSPSNSSCCVNTVNKAIQNNKVIDVKNKEREIPSTISICVGQSYGCFVAMRSFKFLPELKSIILLAPAVNYGQKDTNCGFFEDGNEFVAYVRRSRPHTYRLADNEEWKKLYEGQLDPSECITDHKIERVLGIVGLQDDSFDLKLLKENFEPLVRSKVGDLPQINLVEVIDGKHKSSSLIVDNGLNEFRKCLAI